MKPDLPPALVSPPDAAAWDALAGASDHATVFHTAAWARLWTGEWPRSRWQALVVPDGAGYAAGLGMIVRDGLPGRSVLAMPFGTYGGPLVRRGHPDAAATRRLLLEGFAAVARARRVLVCELSWYQGRRAEVPSGLRVAEVFTHVRPLHGDFAALLASLPHSVRSRVRQAENYGLAVQAVADDRGVRAYHELAVRTVRRRGGRPKPLSLYLRILAELVPAGLARYDLVLHAGRPIAGSLHFLHRGVGTNWLTVSDERHWRLRPNNLLIARVLHDLCAAGFREYNLGGSPPEAAGLIRFKEGWGATRQPVLELRRRSLLHRLLRG